MNSSFELMRRSRDDTSVTGESQMGAALRCTRRKRSSSVVLSACVHMFASCEFVCALAETDIIGRFSGECPEDVRKWYGRHGLILDWQTASKVSRPALFQLPSLSLSLSGVGALGGFAVNDLLDHSSPDMYMWCAFEYLHVRGLGVEVPSAHGCHGFDDGVGSVDDDAVLQGG